jgi:zinc protease
MSFTTNVVRLVLPNGLTLLVERVPSSRTVAVVTHVKAGYFDEPDEWVGISHVLEHMFFKGTARRGPGDVARDTQLLGGYVNAGTIYDKTVYYTVLPSAAGGLERAIDVQADALRNSVIAAEELERELEVIIQEANRKLDSPPAVASESLYALLFRVHRMRRWRIGTEEGLRRLTRDDVLEYYSTRYTPDRVIIGIVGDVHVERALALAQGTYGDWERPSARVRGSPPEPADVEPAVRVMHGDVERPMVRLGWRTVGTLHPDAPALDVAADIVGLGRGSRLYRGVRMPGLAHLVAAGHYTPTEVGVFELGLEGDAARLDGAVVRALKLVQALRSDGPSEDELRRVRAMMAAQWARRFETVQGRATVLCEAEALGDFTLADTLYQRFLASGAGDVQRVAQRYLDIAGAAAVWYLPTGSSTRFEAAWPPRASTDGAGALPPLTTPAARVTPGEPPSDRIHHAGGVWRWAGAGADLLVKQQPGTGLVTLGLHVLGLPGGETADTAGLSWLTVRAALRGAGELSGEQLAQAAEVLGGAPGPAGGPETLGWWMTVPVDHAAAAARLLRTIALEPALAPDAVTFERDQQIGDAKSVRDNMFRHPLQRVLAHAFPNDPYGLPPLGTPESVAALGPERVREWAAGMRGHRALAVAVGDAAPETLMGVLAPFAEWPAADGGGDGPPSTPWTAGRGTESRRKAQSALAMAFPAVPLGSPERYVIQVLTALLSGLSGRLFEELRERRSLAYTVAALPWLARRAGSVLTYIATSPEREEEARDAMLAELARVLREPPAPDELERARNYAAGSIELDRQRGRMVADEVLAGWLHGYLDELPHAAERLRSVTRDELVAVAEQVFDPERRAEYIVRGRVGSGKGEA